MSSFRRMLRPFVRVIRRARGVLEWSALGSRRVERANKLGIFDPLWYGQAYPDVFASGGDPFRHYMTHGWREGRIPSDRFGLIRTVPGLATIDLSRTNPLLEILRRLQRGQVSDQDLDVLRRRVRRRPTRDAASPKEGVLLSGFFRSEIGLGQSARLLSYAMDSARISLSLRDIPLPRRGNEQGFETKLSHEDRRIGVWFVGLEYAGLRRCPDALVTCRVLYPYWELESVPAVWQEAVREYDAVWAPSSFIASALRSMGIDAPLIPQPVIVPIESRLVPIRASSEPLHVLTYLDFDSFPARKNVRAAVNAFRRAFPAGHPALLTVKVRGLQGRGERSWLAAQAAQDPRVRVIDKTLQWHEVDALVRDCDVFLSLHRSEGFGFGAAEALSHGKAVVSTDYGGVRDFVTPETGFPVEYARVPVRRDEYPHWEGQHWAEPSMDHAVELLTVVDRDRDQAAARGRLGRQRMIEQYAPEVVGRLVREWLSARGLL
jgi:glycosyltransferase involved in cell wall biosynthesis